MNPFMRIEAQARATSAMELAFVSSGVAGSEDSINRVYFDTWRHEQELGLLSVSRHNALYDLLMFPLVHDEGVGGFFYPRDGSVGKAFPERAPALPGAPGAGVQNSRQMEDTLNF